jgi:hypothetical protein
MQVARNWLFPLIAVLQISCTRIEQEATRITCGGRTARLMSYSDSPLRSKVRIETKQAPSQRWETIYQQEVESSPGISASACTADQKLACIHFDNRLEKPRTLTIDLEHFIATASSRCLAPIEEALKQKFVPGSPGPSREQ